MMFPLRRPANGLLAIAFCSLLRGISSPLRSGFEVALLPHTNPTRWRVGLGMGRAALKTSDAANIFQQLRQKCLADKLRGEVVF